MNMNASQKAILHVFDEHVFGAMHRDLDWALRGAADNLAALGLVAYTEFLGGLVTGDLGCHGTSGSNFRAFLPYLGSDYAGLWQQGVDIKQRFPTRPHSAYFI